MKRVLWTIVAMSLAGTAEAGTLQVAAVSPAPRALTASTTTSIEVTFDRAIDKSTLTDASLWAFGRWSGLAEGTLSVSPDGETALLVPDHPFSAGEMVTVYVSHDVAGDDGTPLRTGGYSFQFWTRAGRADRSFDEIASLTTRTTPGEGSRAYGGIASDMNADGFLDVTIVNEDTSDLRVFLNKATGEGTFDPFIEPTTPVGNRASPSEPSDFNRDGHVDVCVANINDDTVSVLLGNGDGTFAPQQVIAVGDAPRGIAVLDVDGDGDVDIVNTNSSGSGSLSLHINDGNGVFGIPTSFDAGSNGEWALGAADMNEDGLLDLVVGARSSQRMIVQLANGDGTFSFGSSTPSAGTVWMLVCGDVNGDGHDDIASVNSTNNQGAILLGDGTGDLGPAATYGTDAFPLATDLADLDGDGDLDWLTSSFSGDWFLFTNDGLGVFAFDQEFLAPIAASCSLPFDFDNDGDLDIALIDEIADVVIFMRNVGCPHDLDNSGAIDFGDLLNVLSNWGPCPGCPADLNHSDVVEFGDLLILLSEWGPCVG